MSVVLPTYNGSELLCGAVQRRRKQAYGNWGLITVGNYSSDETPAIAASRAQDDTWGYSVRHKQNREQPTALNAGLALAHRKQMKADDNCYRQG